MSNVIEINSSDDEAVDVEPTPVDDDEVIVLSGEVESTNNIDLTNDTALNDFIKDIQKTYKETTFTREFLQFVKLSYDLEVSDGMKRIIIKNLVPAYTKADPKYTSSNRFKIFVLNSIYKMNTSPDYKFSHIKDLCDVLKTKSLVKVTTLIEENKTVSGIKRNKQPAPDLPSKHQKLDVIDLDEEVINIDTVEDFNHNEEKENSKMRNTAILEKNTVTYEQKTVVNEQVTYNRTTTTYKQNSVTCEQNSYFLKDMVEGVSTGFNKPVDIRIKELEKLIKSRKTLIETLEQQEVDWDDDCSAYIRVDGLKQDLVSLYKQLCKLRGEDITKKTKQIRLYAADGRHPGPSQKLELWLNSQTEENGMPRFPDLFDVVKCVEEACKEYGLNWEKQEVLQEARLLFTQCGKALQRRRQKREWKELLRAAPDDPAEHDIELQARLEHNRKVARAREEAVLTHYSKMDEIRIKTCRNQRRNQDNATTPEPNGYIQTGAPFVLTYPPEMPIDMPSSPSTSEIIDKVTECSLPYTKDIPSTSNPGNSFQGTFVSQIHKSDDTKENENPKDVNETNNQDQSQQIVQVNALNYATLRELGLNNFVESQIENENNTNLELDRVGNVNSEARDDVENVGNINSEELDAVENEPEVKHESTSGTNASKNMENHMLIEQDIPIENGYDGSNLSNVKFEAKPEFEAIEETENKFLPEIDSCDEITASNYINTGDCVYHNENENVTGDNSRNDDANTEEQNTASDNSLLNNTNTEGEIKIKTESIQKEDETLKLMLEFDGEFSDTVISKVFDIEEPVVFIEISSSEDESGSEDLDEEEDLIQLGEEPL